MSYKKKDMEPKKIDSSKVVMGGVALVGALGLFVYFNLPPTQDTNLNRCYEITAERLGENPTSEKQDLAKWLCDEPCYRNKFVEMVDKKGMKLDSLEIAYGFVSKICDRHEK